MGRAGLKRGAGGSNARPLADLPRDPLDLDRVEVEKRYAKFMRCRDSHGTRIGQTFADQVRDQRHTFLLRGLGCVLELLFRDNTVLHQAPWKA